jgi:arylformamidase
VSDWIDISVPVRAGMLHWPDDPPVQIGLSGSIGDGDPANVSRLSMSAHTGTHIDAPRHFSDDGAGIDAMPVEAMVGPATVIEIADPAMVTARELQEHGLEAGGRLLLRTRNSDREWWLDDFDERFVHLEPAAAELIAERGVRTVGVDYLSVGGMEAGREVHLALLEAGAWIIEGLALGGVRSGDYELFCLPLKIVGCDGAPARALLRPHTEPKGERR